VNAKGELSQVLDDALLEVLSTVLRHPKLDAAFKELVLTLPAETYIAEQLEVVDLQRIHTVRKAMRAKLAEAFHNDRAWAFESHRKNGSYQTDPVSSSTLSVPPKGAQMDNRSPEGLAGYQSSPISCFSFVQLHS